MSLVKVGMSEGVRYFFITIMLAMVWSNRLHAQDMTTSAPPQKKAPSESPGERLPDAPGAGSPAGAEHEQAGQAHYPDAVPLLAASADDAPIMTSATQSYRAGVFVLDGNVVITRGDRRVEADHIEYDSNTGELTATGHLVVSGGANTERIAASHGSYNLKSATGRFYDVSGSVGLKVDLADASRRGVYVNANPFLFTGRLVVKTGPRDYEIYDGTVTSCQLPRPDWVLSSSHFNVDDEKAKAKNSTFRLLNVPVFFLPYVTHSLDAEDRQSGFAVPTIGQSNTKGLVLGEEVYFALSRSADLNVGAEYYSAIGFAQNASFRFRGPGLDFANIKYTGVLDRRSGTANQGGEDALAAGRFDFTANTRAAGNIEYLSSYVYREAFSNNFNQAVNSDIVSTVYATRETDGLELAGEVDRYQGIKLIAQGTTPQQQVRIFHAPSLYANTTEHRVPGTGLEFSFESQASGLKRTQPNFATGGIVERFDVRPRLSYPLHAGGWNLVPSVDARETVYSRSRVPVAAGQAPVESLSALSRSSFDFEGDIRPPVLTRTFTPGRFERLLGTEVRHTIEPEVIYRLTRGIDNFSRILRFDQTDVASNTNELEYGVTQRLFRKVSTGHGCGGDSNGGLNPEEAVTSPGDCRNEQLISWRLSQKYFFDPTFGGAVATGRRNIFETTLLFSGVAFLTEPRNISPLISRLRVRTSGSTDVEWDFDIDTGAAKFTSSNVYIDVHHGNAFTALSYARLDAPGRFYTQGDSTTAATGVTSSVSDFNQLRYLIGYGSPAKSGLSLAANTGLDLKSLYGTTATTITAGKPVTTTIYPALFQYATVQASYNWNCCGLSVEYRKFELGSVRNENSYRFNFTLVNVGSAGNLRRAERLF